MDTLAYLYLAQENEDSDSRELTLNPTELSKWIATGVLGIGCTVGVFTIAEPASACSRPCRPCPCPTRIASSYPRPERSPYSRAYYSYSADATPAPIPRFSSAPPPYRPIAPTASPPTPPPSTGSSSTVESGAPATESLDTVSDASASSYYSGYLYHGNDGVASIGYYGEIVTAAQQRLQELGYYQGEVDSLFGPLTLEAVLAYQEAEGLQLVDGIIGPETRASLGV